ncbi:unnamed protein product [Effrenium voratum]|uniref:RRM domain-containing protein n=1 Tax=Effrenium voratum TaxID=2562239 RepID=A0AA36MVL2_9DINO|nr:unnamed protein product [Effrenium voratum]
MGCGAQGAKKLEEAEILSTQLRSSLKKQELELQRLEAHEAANSKERTRLRQELDEARSEDALAKALAEIRSLREKVASSEAAASAEATRSSRLDGRCSVLEVESRALRDELTAASSAHFQSQEASDNLHQQLTARKQELTQLHVQLQSLSDEASDLQAQRDYALSELKAANQVAEALKATSTALDGKRPRKPRKPCTQRLFGTRDAADSLPKPLADGQEVTSLKATHLPPTVDEDDLRAIFGRELCSIQLPRNCGYAILGFRSAESAEKALKRNGQRIPDHKAVLRLARSSATPGRRPLTDYQVCVGNLAPNMTDADLYEAFRSLSTDVLGARVPVDHTGRSKGFGFVRLADDDAAEPLVAKKQGFRLAGRAATLRQCMAPDAAVGDKVLFISNMEPGTREDWLRTLLCVFGELEFVEMGFNGGFARVGFREAEAALAAGSLLQGRAQSSGRRLLFRWARPLPPDPQRLQFSQRFATPLSDTNSDNLGRELAHSLLPQPTASERRVEGASLDPGDKAHWLSKQLAGLGQLLNQRARKARLSPMQVAIAVDSSSEGSALAVPMPEVPWADSPLQASPQAFAFEREGKLSLENAGGAAPSSGMQEAAKEMPKIYTDPNAKVFQFDFSVFDFLKHEALQTPPESPLEVLPVEVSDKWSDARWSTRV